MRIAVCSPDMDERHALSKLVETTLLRRGVLPEMVLFSMPQELLTAAVRDTPLDAALIAAGGKLELASICCHTPVILIGGKNDGDKAFDIGARYFLEDPVDKTQLEKALTRCLGGNKEEK